MQTTIYIVLGCFLALGLLLVYLLTRKKKTIRLCVAGTMGSGKTFLINGLVKLLTDFNITSAIPYKLEPITDKTKKAITDIINDIKTNIKSGSTSGTTGTKHSPDPDLYEYQYDNILLRKNPSSLNILINRGLHNYPNSKFLRFLKQKCSGDIYFQIKNIPGEMFHYFFRHRSKSSSIHEIFSNFLNSDIHAKKLLADFAKNKELDLNEFSSLRDRFHTFCDSQLDTTDKTDLDEIKQNFFSYLFYLSSTDVVICHDVTINTSDPNYYSQSNFLSVFNPGNHNLGEGKKIYYAFTKYDSCVGNPETNYVSTIIDSIEKYWDLTEKNLHNIYTGNSSISSNLLQQIEVLLENRAIVPRRETDNIKVLKYTFFVCTNYCNLSYKRGFLAFKGTTLSTSAPTVANVWDENNYFNESFPLGIIELLVTFLNRNKLCKHSHQGLGNLNSYDVVKEVCI